VEGAKPEAKGKASRAKVNFMVIQAILESSDRDKIRFFLCELCSAVSSARANWLAAAEVCSPRW
jgi:hypothetical protein